MARIAGVIVIGQPVEVVFEVVADQHNEPTYNPAMTRSQKLTEEGRSWAPSFRRRQHPRGASGRSVHRVHDLRPADHVRVHQQHVR